MQRRVFTYMYTRELPSQQTTHPNNYVKLVKIFFFFFLISKKKYIQIEPHENIRQTREYRKGHKQREKQKKKQ